MNSNNKRFRKRSARRTFAGFWPVLAASLLSSGLVQAEDRAADEATKVQGKNTTKPEQGKDVATLKEVVVFGRADQQIGVAAAASEGTVGGADLSMRPLLRVAELFEAVPGLIAAQHSGSGKANQYFLRGFNLDHGTDFAAYVDDMPWNLRTHGHGQGYLDVNGLIPETVTRIDYRKGPYRADVGDFGMTGVSFVSTIDQLERPFVSAEVGDYGWRRTAAGGSTPLGSGTLTAVGQWKTYEGPWELSEDLQHQSLWAKYMQDTSLGLLKVSLSGYHATWHPTEQIPEESVGTDACANDYCDLSPSARGETSRWIATANLIGDDWRATLYGQYYDWRMSSDPTYDYQIDQFDRRHTVGGRYERGFVKNDSFEFTAGTEARYDRIGRVGVDHIEDGVFVENIASNRVDESSVAVYGEATWRPTDALRLMAGLRGDYYHFDVEALSDSPGNASGKSSDQALSPKFGVAYALNDQVEFYGNWGKGFHSNDARGVLSNDQQIDGIAQGTGYEAGLRFEVGNLRLSAAYWWLNVSSELIFVGDSNSVEPRDGSKREGLELVAFWRPVEWLGIDAVYTASHARYDSNQEDPDYDSVEAPGLVGRYIEGAIESAGELGVAAAKGRWELSGRLRYLGPYAMVPSNTKRAQAETVLNLRGSYKFNNHLTVYAELLNALDHHGKEISYYYDSFIPGVSEPGTQQATTLSRANEPRTVRFGIKYEF